MPLVHFILPEYPLLEMLETRSASHFGVLQRLGCLHRHHCLGLPNSIFEIQKVVSIALAFKDFEISEQFRFWISELGMFSLYPFMYCMYVLYTKSKEFFGPLVRDFHSTGDDIATVEYAYYVSSVILNK